MNYFEFMENLEKFGFDRLGKSSAFLEHGDWIVGIIGMSGRYQRKGSKAFVICARPKMFAYGDIPKHKYATEPHEYPFKLTRYSFDSGLKYQSNFLRYELDRAPTESDWTSLYKILTSKLPAALDDVGVPDLLSQLKKIGASAWIEKIWIGGENA